MACHDIGVYVNGVDGVGDADSVVFSEDVEDVAGVALGAIGNEDFISSDIAAARLEIVLGDGFAQNILSPPAAT